MAALACNVPHAAAFALIHLALMVQCAGFLHGNMLRCVRYLVSATLKATVCHGFFSNPTYRRRPASTISPARNMQIKIARCEGFRSAFSTPVAIGLHLLPATWAVGALGPLAALGTGLHRAEHLIRLGVDGLALRRRRVVRHALCRARMSLVVDRITAWPRCLRRNREIAFRERPARSRIQTCHVTILHSKEDVHYLASSPNTCNNSPS